jgi:hypothetical protein
MFGNDCREEHGEVEIREAHWRRWPV